MQPIGAQVANMPIQGTGTLNSTTAQRVVPLLQSLSRTEELLASLVMRLDPVTNHTPAQDTPPNSLTVTGRVNSLGDTLQYLLDNIEL